MQQDEFQFLQPIDPDTKTIYDSDSIEEHNYRRHELDIGNEDYDQPDLEQRRDSLQGSFSDYLPVQL